MSTASDGPLRSNERNVRVISHSPLFYWWPVWVAGFAMALLTYWDGHLMAIVPPGTEAVANRQVEGFEGPRDVLVAPAGKRLPYDRHTETLTQPEFLMAVSNSYGVIFTVVLLLVIVITNIHLRGLWSVIIIISLVFATILFAVLGWWDPILRFLFVLDIHVNAIGYLSIAGLLFAVWLVTLLLYDRRHYMIFSPGQMRVRQAIGMGDTAFEALGMVVQKRRDDLFRHWLLGFGSGDLSVRTGGATPQVFEMPNVLFVGYKVKQIQQLLREREMVNR